MTNYKVKKLSDHASAQCCVRLYDNGDICFQSYKTDVLYYDATYQRLYCSGTYSQTTRKQISWFLREYFPYLSYYDCKAAYQQDSYIDVDVEARKKLLPLTKYETLVLEHAHHGYTINPDAFKEA